MLDKAASCNSLCPKSLAKGPNYWPKARFRNIMFVFLVVLINNEKKRKIHRVDSTRWSHNSDLGDSERRKFADSQRKKFEHTKLPVFQGTNVFGTSAALDQLFPNWLVLKFVDCNSETELGFCHICKFWHKKVCNKNGFPIDGVKKPNCQWQNCKTNAIDWKTEYNWLWFVSSKSIKEKNDFMLMMSDFGEWHLMTWQTSALLVGCQLLFSCWSTAGKQKSIVVMFSNRVQLKVTQKRQSSFLLFHF